MTERYKAFAAVFTTMAALFVNCGGVTSGPTAVPDAGNGSDSSAAGRDAAAPEAAVPEASVPDAGRDGSLVPDASGDSEVPPSCIAGAPCNPGGDGCQTGTIACANGQATCVPTGDVADGTVCKEGLCCGGLCAACGPISSHAVAACDGKTCAVTCVSGYTRCGDACVDATSDRSACGPSCTVCPPGSSCEDSQCGPCVQGAPCNPEENPCQVGTAACEGGAPTCTPSGGNVPDGTSCGTDHVCANGVCTECIAGAACSPAGNGCVAGVTSCTTGQSVCTPSGNLSDGTPCTNGACCNGSCIDTTSNASACGTMCRVCPGDAQCKDSTCTIDYGSFTPYYPCGNSVTFLQARLLAVQQVTISDAITVLALGVVGNQPSAGLNGALALYSDASGAPASLVASTASAPIVAGKNELIVLSGPTLSPGTYWVGGEFDANASICSDNSTSNPVDYVMESTYPTMPSSLAAATQMPSVDFNFYVVGGL